VGIDAIARDVRMINRFLVAKTLNSGDQLVWYKKYRGEYLRCLWRPFGNSERTNGITFVATWVHSDRVYKVFTITFPR